MAILALTVLPSLHAQTQPNDLGLQGTAAYNMIWNGTTDGPREFKATAFRFSGRVAVRLTSQLYAGVGVGSWQYAQTFNQDGVKRSDFFDDVATAVVTTGYLQYYPMHRSPTFLRAGIGFANSTVYYPGDHDLYSAENVRPSLTIGAGYDISLRKHLALTLSLDFTRLLGVDATGELKTGLLGGIGLTVR